jgi:hypothetical protein
MKRESVESLRTRLLADDQVHSMIEIRAYEIYRLRGGAPGLEAEDWLQAEAEILTFLIEEEARRSETEAIVAHSLARGLGGHSAVPIQTPEQTATEVSSDAGEMGQPISRSAETTELASPLGLADFLTDRSPHTEPTTPDVEDRGTKSLKTRSRELPAKSRVARKEAGEKQQKAKASTKKESKASGEKKPGRKPKKS